MNIWFDFHAAPDPFFFRPIIKKMRCFGHNIIITTREYSETVAVARHCGFEFKVVGTHGGDSLVSKVVSTSKRICSLTKLVKNMDVDLAVSFNSYAQAITAKLCGIKFITFMDYEYHPLNYLAFRLANKVIVPCGYKEGILAKQVDDIEKVHKFTGLKENISLLEFVPDCEFFDKLGKMGISQEDIIVTMRPPPSFSTYHRFNNELFDQLALYIARHSHVKIVYLPRTALQAKKISYYNLNNLVIPPFFLDGLQLNYFSDLVISAGGSMNREAVALGTPACTLFKGKMAGVDQKLIDDGVMTKIDSYEEFKNIVLEKNIRKPVVERRTELLDQIIKIISVHPETPDECFGGLKSLCSLPPSTSKPNSGSTKE